MAGYSDDMLALRTSYEGKLRDLRAANSELAARATQAEAELASANERIAELEAALVPAYEGGVDHAFEAAKEAAAGELAASQEQVRVMREALEGVVRVADRKTVEFDKARAALAQAEGGGNG